MKRVIRHPILDTVPKKPHRIRFTFENNMLEGYEGEPIAAALTAYGIMDLHYSHKYKQPRGIFCGIGQCQECVMVVDGIPNVRTCITPLREGMQIERQRGRGEMPSRENADG